MLRLPRKQFEPLRECVESLPRSLLNLNLYWKCCAQKIFSRMTLGQLIEIWKPMEAPCCSIQIFTYTNMSKIWYSMRKITLSRFYLAKIAVGKRDKYISVFAYYGNILSWRHVDWGKCQNPPFWAPSFVVVALSDGCCGFLFCDIVR